MPSLTEADLALRRTGVTATDVVVLAGLSPYAGASAHTVFAEKLGLPIERKSSEAMDLGHELEPIVLQRLAVKRDLVLSRGASCRNEKAPTHLASPDAFAAPREHGPHTVKLFDGGPYTAVVDAKAVGFRFASQWGEDGESPPDHVVAQVAWQMHVTDLPRAYVGALLGTEVRTYEVARDAELEAALIEIADRFWTNHVLTRKPPAIDGSEGAGQMVAAIVGKPRGPMVKASVEIEEAARLYFECEQASALTEGALQQARNILKLACGEAEGIKGDGWRLLYRWREPTMVEAYEKKGYRHFDLRKAGR
jgi:hypothetical protein